LKVTPPLIHGLIIDRSGSASRTPARGRFAVEVDMIESGVDAERAEIQSCIEPVPESGLRGGGDRCARSTFITEIASRYSRSASQSEVEALRLSRRRCRCKRDPADENERKSDDPHFYPVG
jgi:hypothetical protein